MLLNSCNYVWIELPFLQILPQSSQSNKKNALQMKMDFSMQCYHKQLILTAALTRG